MDKKRVLLVDDELDFLELLHTRVHSWGYEVIDATDGKRALKAVKEKEADIVVLDYLMPGMNGHEVLKAIRAIDHKIPVIIFTCHPDLSEAKGLQQLNISALISKVSHCTDTDAALKSVLDLVSKSAA